ncbi:MAG: FkbM family methyltransferase [Saprospiraceae bacterium]|nr:FkbM family methyltransferase [Saprospiraceae bacterium]
MSLYLFLEYHFYRLQGIDHKWFNLKRGKMYLPLSPVISGNGRRLESREPQTEEVLKSILKPGMNVLEIGACMGEFTLLISKLIGNTGKCYSIEPFPKYARIFKMNIDANKLANVVHLPYAVGKGVGEISFSDDDNASYNGIKEIWDFAPLKKVTTERGDGKITKVPVVKISDLIHKEKLDIDFIFMDIEGRETLVFDDLYKHTPQISFLIFTLKAINAFTEIKP